MEQVGEQIFKGLNPAQYQAVSDIEGPQLIIAGAGSGKTKVLTCRIANILSQGHDPASILALTFTNKAAREMKERIASLIGEGRARRLYMGTFHSIFIRFLREEAELLGFPKTFSIYDTTDSRNVIKACIKELQLDDKIYKPNEVHSRISMAKNNLVTAESYGRNSTLIQNDSAAKKPRIWEIYREYAKKCRQAGAMDFDDILLYTNILFRDFPEAMERIRNRFKFVMVDEYQDTNYAQDLIIKKLSGVHQNISVVGDDAQSIYSFRGARIENILNFRKDYPQAKEYRLEQNYRSTQTIVNAANSLIAKNKMQLKKKCFSEGERGDLIELISAYTEHEEGFLVASSIMDQVRRTHEPYSSFAILYRTNAQSRVIEEALRKKNMPYKIFAGHSFYERAEVKDMLAYLKLVSNIKDDEAFKRVINFPARGIGDTSLGRLKEAATAKELSMFEAVKVVNLEEFGIKAGTSTKMKHFIEGIESLRDKMDYTDAYTMAMEVNSRFGVIEYMKQDTTLEAQGRVQNVEELFNSIKDFVDDGEAEYEQLAQEGEDIPVVTLDLYLENVSLISDLDGKETEDDKNKIALMTVHSSKGLEFPYVYIVGMEENLFPSQGMGMATEQDMEEERRLFYVAVTRAGKGVKLSYAQSRTKWGNHVSNPPSRFIKEIDKEYILNPITDWEEELSTKYDDFSSSRQYPSSRTSQGGVPQRGGGSGYSPQGGQRFPGRQGTPVHGASAGRTGGSGYQGAGSGAQQRVNPPAGFVPQKKAAPANFTPDSPAVVEVGQTIEHDRFGIGVVISLEGDITSRKAVVNFRDSGQKTLLLKFAKFRVVAR